jgi:hypothetical protein
MIKEIGAFDLYRPISQCQVLCIAPPASQQQSGLEIRVMWRAKPPGKRFRDNGFTLLIQID